MKKYFVPDAQYTVTDISPFAIESLHYWEAVFDVKILHSLACKSYEVPLKDESFDLIFCYAAAHHFVRIKESLAELKRLLKPGGCILFLYEPTCSKWFYPLHFKYVNSVNHSTPEDILIPSDIEKIARSLDLTYTHFYDAQQRIIRSISLAIYFRILKTFPFLQSILPSSSDMLFTK